jgi:hypothetical protein
MEEKKAIVMVELVEDLMMRRVLNMIDLKVRVHRQIRND